MKIHFENKELFNEKNSPKPKKKKIQNIKKNKTLKTNYQLN